ncbi:hypothetical protein C2E23DRAFT_812656 [Lenzites betulinus]|nr:hypothetical protein C2E23DRAFT_812656 [Lenzites betulinus]
MGLTTSTRSVIGCPPHAYGKSRQPLQPPPPLSAVTAAADAQQPERAPQSLDPSAPSFSPGNTVRPSSSNDAAMDINYYMASVSSSRGSSTRVGSHVANSLPSHEPAASQETMKSVMAVSKLESLVLSSTTRITPGIPAKDGSVVSQTATIVPDAASNPENSSPSSTIFYVSSGGEGEGTADRTPTVTSPTAHAGGPHGTVETGTGTSASAEAFVKPEPTEAIFPLSPCHAHAPIQSIASPVPRTSSAASSSSYNSFSSDSGTSETRGLSPASPNGSASVAQQLLAARIDRLEAQIQLLQDELQALRLEVGHVSHT